MASIRLCIAIAFLAVIGTGRSEVAAQSTDTDCSGTPSAAVREVPAPLSKWARISCRPFGHVLSSRDGWLWLWEDGTGGVFLPSQMVERGPKPLGNASYFTKIGVTKVTGSEYDDAYRVFHEGLDDGGAAMPDGYRVDLTSVSGKALRLYFFDYDTYAWAISCPETICLRDSRFMIIDKAKKPQPRKPSI